MSSEAIKPVANFSFIESVEGLITLRHDFVQDEQGVIGLKPGVNVSPKDVLSLLDTLLSDEKGQGFINPNVIYEKGRVIAWKVQGGTRKLFFSVKGKKFSFETKLPDLVFISNGSNLNAVAVKDKVITPKTECYHAPLLNFYADTRLCFGSIKRPKKLNQNTLSEWESMIFDSYSSHSNHKEVIKLKEYSDEAYIEFMKSLQDAKSFPKSSLVSINKTLQQVIEG